MNRNLSILLKVVAILALLFFCYLMFMISLPYFPMDKHARIQFLMTKLNVYHIDYWRAGFYIHVFTSVLALAAGLTQFSATIMRKFPKLHRRMGWIYIVVVLFLSGPGALVMSIHANGGFAAKISFTVLSIIWIIFTFIAFQKIRKKNFIAHGEFMLRSYALTFSAITLRMYLVFINYFHFGLSPIEKYVLVAYLSWIPNLLLAEFLIRRGFIKKLMARRIGNSV